MSSPLSDMLMFEPGRCSMLLGVSAAMKVMPLGASSTECMTLSSSVGRIGHRVDGPDAPLRVELAAAQLIGVAVLRYVLEVEPITSASTDDLVDWLGPTLGGYFRPRRPPTR